MSNHEAGGDQELCSGSSLQKGPNDFGKHSQMNLTSAQPYESPGKTEGGVDDAVTEEHVELDNADDRASEWSQDSFLEENIEEVDDEDLGPGNAECCTVTESKFLRRQLREVGPEEFIRRTIESGEYSARKLCSAFGVPALPLALADADDDAIFPLLGALMSRELSKRHRLEAYTTIDDASRLLNECNNIVVLTGAGISTNLGIPDFRSKGTGLYSRLAHLGLSDPQEVFDIRLFREDPSIFYSIAKDIVPSTKRFSPTHAFIRLLQDKGKLLTNFTQNIENLEGAAGILPEKLIQCHGSFATATCLQCSFQCPGDQIIGDMKAGRVPRCPACARRIRQMGPLGLKRKRNTGSATGHKKRKHDYDDDSDDESDDDDMEVAGVMKPDITFFGEDLPQTFHERLIDHDKARVDLMIVIGTSLKVAPVADIPDFLPSNIPQIYISLDPVKHIEFDIELLGDCDQIVTELCRRAGWNLEHEMVTPGQVLQATPYVPAGPAYTTAQQNAATQAPDVGPITRWVLKPIEGSVTTKREALDSGTVGHGSAISPSQEEFSAKKNSPARSPELELPNRVKGTRPLAKHKELDPSKAESATQSRQSSPSLSERVSERLSTAKQPSPSRFDHSGPTSAPVRPPLNERRSFEASVSQTGGYESDEAEGSITLVSTPARSRPGSVPPGSLPGSRPGTSSGVK